MKDAPEHEITIGGWWHPGGDLRAGRDRDLFGDTRQRAGGDAYETDPLAGGGSGADVRVVPRGLSRDHGPGAHFVHYRNCGVIGGFIGGSHAVWGQTVDSRDGEFLQVSELVKLIIIIVLARFFAEVRTDELSLQDLIKAGLMVGLPLA